LQDDGFASPFLPTGDAIYPAVPFPARKAGKFWETRKTLLEWVTLPMKNEFGGRQVWVKGACKEYWTKTT
jgi:hypothetical protein